MHKSRKAVRLKPLVSRRRTAKARAAAGLAPRRKGAQLDNDNRLVHGRYSRAFRTRHGNIRNLLRETRIVIAKLTAKTSEVRGADAAALETAATQGKPPSPSARADGADTVAERNLVSELS
jgi:hypothetical protein